MPVAGCVRREPDDGKLHLTYWEKWQRFEGEAMRRVVDAFNASQDEIVVHYTPMGLIERKTLTATAGGDPPDLAGLWDNQVASFADRGIFTPLDEYMKRDGITRDHWTPVYADICTHRGHMWAVPTTPATVALHWNKALFRDADLDPDQPPRTLAELDDFAEKLTKYDDDGNIIQMGFLPQEPGWFHWAWANWFGGQLVDDEGNITATHPRNIEAFEWCQSYSRKYGVDRVRRFASGFGNFASPQNPFFSGKIAMVVQGVWMHNWISQFAPGMQWGAAPFPQTPHGPEHYTVAGCDILVIPAGVPKQRRDAAWEFIKFVISQEGMEMLNLGHRKFTPLAEVSQRFLDEHPHPYLSVFIDMSKYPEAMSPLRIGVWTQYQMEIYSVFEKMRVLEVNPATGKPYTAAEALEIAQRRMSLAHKRHQESLALHASASEGLP